MIVSLLQTIQSINHCWVTILECFFFLIFGCGKTNNLMHVIKKSLCYYDQIIIYTPNKDQDKLVSLKNKFAQVSQLVGHQVLLLYGQEDILNTDEYESDDCVKLVVFDDLMNADKKNTSKDCKPFY